MPALFAIVALLAAPAVSSTPHPPAAGDEHIQYWVRTLQTHPMELVRKNAARNLGSLQDRAAVSTLIAALKDPYHGVRVEAAKSLGLLGDEQAMTPLYEVFQRDKDAQVRRSAKDAIERIKAYQDFQRKKQEKLEKR